MEMKVKFAENVEIQTGLYLPLYLINCQIAQQSFNLTIISFVNPAIKVISLKNVSKSTRDLMLITLILHNKKPRECEANFQSLWLQKQPKIKPLSGLWIQDKNS
jgi:hypothetical protein